MSAFAKSKKLKKPEVSGVSLDNTAPVQAILDELLVKNPAAHRLYCRVLGRRAAHVRATHCCLAGDALAAFPPRWDGELSPDYHRALSLRGTRPRMLLPPRHPAAADPVSQPLAVKDDWSVSFQNMMAAAQSCKELGSYRRLSESVARCPQHYVSMAGLLAAEPAPHLRAHYNWQYAGRGNLRAVADCLVRAALTSVVASRLCDDRVTPDPDSSATFDCGHDILETVCSADARLVALRTQHKVFLLELTTRDDQLSFKLLKTFTSKVIYTSVEFDCYHESVLYMSKIDDTLDIANLRTLQSRRVVLSPQPRRVDNWGCVRGLDRLHYAHVTSRAVAVFDKRSHRRLYSVASQQRLCEQCGDITAAARSERLPHALYLATDHHVFCLDVRSVRGRRHKFLMRWTHGMRCPPTLMERADFAVGQEAVFLSSQWPADTTLLVNDTAHLRAGLPPACSYLPYRPPSIFDSLRDAQLKKLCLEPTLHVDRRVAACVTGLCVRDKDERFELLLQNSLGDVSVSTVYPEHHRDFVVRDRSAELDAWSRELRVPPAPLAATDVLDVSRLWAFRRCVDSRCPRWRASRRANYSEEAIVQLFESEDFDKDLLEAILVVNIYLNLCAAYLYLSRFIFVSVDSRVLRDLLLSCRV